jgi:hypothetical protein
LHDDGFAENCNSEQIAVLKEKVNSGAVPVGFFPRVEYQKVEQLSQISIG